MGARLYGDSELDLPNGRLRYSVLSVLARCRPAVLSYLWGKSQSNHYYHYYHSLSSL